MRNILVINLDIIGHNIKEIKKQTGKEIMVVVKSNAYNLGDRYIIKYLLTKEINFFVFNRYNEYQKCQDLLTNAKVLILETLPIDIIEKLPYNVRISVNSVPDIYDLIKIKKDVIIHYQIDTGMNRFGIKKISELKKIIRLVKNNHHLKSEGIYTHFLGDNNDFYYYHRQQQRFLTFLYLDDFKIVHTGATSSLGKSLIGNYVRVGMGIYGYHNALKNIKGSLKLLTHLEEIKIIKKGETVGYQALYQAEEETKIGILPIGYYEGMKAYDFQYQKTICHVIGKICMNHTFIKLPKIIKNDSLLNIFPINDRIDNNRVNYYEVITGYKNLKRIYITENNYDVRKIFKITNQKGFIFKQRKRSG